MKLPLAAVLFGLTGCTDGVPELGRGLSDNLVQANDEFDHRVKERFAVGMPESELVTELSRQGFERLPPYRGVQDATFYHREFPFVTIWSIRWRTSDGKVTDIWGVHGVRGP